LFGEHLGAKMERLNDGGVELTRSERALPDARQCKQHSLLVLGQPVYRRLKSPPGGVWI